MSSGRSTCRRNYFDATDSLIFVIDSADKKRILESGSELDQILEASAANHCSICICMLLRGKWAAISSLRYGILIIIRIIIRHACDMSCLAF